MPRHAYPIVVDPISDVAPISLASISGMIVTHSLSHLVRLRRTMDKGTRFNFRVDSFDPFFLRLRFQVQGRV